MCIRKKDCKRKRGRDSRQWSRVEREREREREREEEDHKVN
jgi:hypothetical protein